VTELIETSNLKEGDWVLVLMGPWGGTTAVVDMVLVSDAESRGDVLVWVELTNGRTEPYGPDHLGRLRIVKSQPGQTPTYAS
jgi:hypothetical protein